MKVLRSFQIDGMRRILISFVLYILIQAAANLADAVSASVTKAFIGNIPETEKGAQAKYMKY